MCIFPLRELRPTEAFGLAVYPPEYPEARPGRGGGPVDSGLVVYGVASPIKVRALMRARAGACVASRLELSWDAVWGGRALAAQHSPQDAYLSEQT